MRAWVLVVLLGATDACGGQSKHEASGNAGSPAEAGRGGSGNGGSSGGSAGRTPEQHRPEATEACPSERGTDARAHQCGDGSCETDAECSEGVNGRCEHVGIGCFSACTYDNCKTDADCPETEPCLCRADATQVAANQCVTNSTCQVDADCGPGGFCSPSLVGVLCACLSADFCDESGMCSPGPCVCGDSCGHAYYCHTPSDECLDDSDCEPDDQCAWDLVKRAWACVYCLRPP